MAVSALTDTIQAATGVAGLVVAILALRETRLQRRASAPLVDRETGPAPESSPPTATPPPVVPSAEPPRVEASAYHSPDTVSSPTGNKSATATSRPAWRAREIAVLGGINGLGYVTVAANVFTTQTQWMIAGLVTLAITIVLFLYALRATQDLVMPVSVVAGCLGGISGSSMIQSFFGLLEPSTPEELVSLAVVIFLAIVWLVRARRQATTSES